jgi:hypothetical protein
MPGLNSVVTGSELYILPLKIKILAKRELTTKLAIARNGCYLVALFSFCV